MFYINNMTQMSCNFKQKSKIVRTTKPPLTKPPPHLFASCDGGFSSWWTAMCRLQARFLLTEFTREIRGGRAG